MKRVRITLALPEPSYDDAAAIACRRGVSFTEAIRGVIETERYLRAAQAAGKVIVIEDRRGHREEIVFD
jgi:hypothetical protein